MLGGPLAPYDSAPAYGVMLGVVYRSLGRSWTAPLVVQALLGACVPLLLYGAGRRLASARVGIAAAALAAFYGPAIFFEGLTVKYALTPVTLSALLCALAAAATGSRAGAAAAGAATALVVAFRPNAVVVLPLGLAWMAWAKPPRVAAASLALFAVGLAAIAGPLAIRRALAAERGDGASLWGIHFYIGSQLRGDGGYTTVLGVTDDVFGHVDDTRAIAEAERQRPLSPGEVSRYWFARGLAEIRADPWGYVKLLGRKLRRMVARDEDGDFGDDWMAYATRSPILRAAIGFGAVAPLAAIGLVVAIAQRSALVWPIVLAAAYTVSLLAFFVTARYRLPIVPTMLLLAGGGLVWLTDAWATRRALAVAAGAALLVIATALGARWSDFAWLPAAIGVAAALRITTGERPSP